MCSAQGDIPFTGRISLSKQGVFSILGGYHEYTGRCSMHQRYIMSTQWGYHDECGDIMSTSGVYDEVYSLNSEQVFS